MKLNWNFLSGEGRGGAKQKALCRGSVDINIFLELHISVSTHRSVQMYRGVLAVKIS